MRSCNGSPNPNGPATAVSSSIWKPQASEVKAVLPRKILEARLRPRTEMRDDLSRSDAAERRAIGKAFAARETGKETRRVEIAGTGRIDEILDRAHRHLMRLLAGDDERTTAAKRDGGEPGIIAQGRDGAVEIRRLIERLRLCLIGKHDIDGARAQEIEEFLTVAVDAEAVGERDRDAAAMGVRGGRRLAEGSLAAGGSQR